MQAAEMGAAHSSHINAGSVLYAVTAGRARSVVAASVTSGIQDNFWHGGVAVDRTTPALFLSAQGAVCVLPVLNTGESVVISRRYRHSDDGITFVEIDAYPDADFVDVTVTAAEMVTTPAPRTIRDNLDLAGCKQYIRQDIKVNLSRANTDVAHISGMFVLAGTDTGPVNEN